MLSGYCLIKMLDDYMNYSKPIKKPSTISNTHISNTQNGPILNNVMVESTLTKTNDNDTTTQLNETSVHINSPVHVPNKHDSDTNYQLTLNLLNKYLFNDSTIIDF